MTRWIATVLGGAALSTMTAGAALAGLPAAPTQVPEPGSLALLGLGVVGFAVAKFRRKG